MTVVIAEPSTSGVIHNKEPSVRPFAYHMLKSTQAVVGIEPETFLVTVMVAGY